MAGWPGWKGDGVVWNECERAGLMGPRRAEIGLIAVNPG